MSYTRQSHCRYVIRKRKSNVLCSQYLAKHTACALAEEVHLSYAKLIQRVYDFMHYGIEVEHVVVAFLCMTGSSVAAKVPPNDVVMPC